MSILRVRTKQFSSAPTCQRCARFQDLVLTGPSKPESIQRGPDGQWDAETGVPQRVEVIFMRTADGWAWQGPVSAEACFPLLKRLRLPGGRSAAAAAAAAAAPPACWHCTDKLWLTVLDGVCFPSPPFKLLVSRGDSVAMLKEVLGAEVGLPPEQLALLQNGRCLSGADISASTTMAELGLSGSATLMLAREGGGAPAPPQGGGGSRRKSGRGSWPP